MKENICFVCGEIHKNKSPFCEKLINTHDDARRDNKNMMLILDESPVECKSIFDNTEFMFNPGMNFIILTTPTQTE